MYNYIRYCSPLGMLTVTEEDGALIALVIDGQKYADRHLDGEGTERECPSDCQRTTFFDSPT